MVFGCISKNFPENIFQCLEKKKENTKPEKHRPQPRKKSSTTTNPVRRPRRRSQSKIAIAISPSSRDRNQRHDLTKRRSRSRIFLSRLHTRSRDRHFARSRSCEIKIAIDGAISIFARSRLMARSCEASIAISDCGRRTGAREIGADWSSEFAGDRRTDWNVSSPLARARARSLSLSLSLSFSGNTLKGKQKCKMISVVKGIFFRSTDFNFRKIEFSGPTKQPHFRKSISGSDFHPKQTQPK